MSRLSEVFLQNKIKALEKRIEALEDKTGVPKPPVCKHCKGTGVLDVDQFGIIWHCHYCKR